MGLVSFLKRNVKGATVKHEVESIAELKQYKTARVGDLVMVYGYHSSGDGGGGLFRLIQVNDFVSGASVSPSGATATRTLTVNWPYGIQRNQPLIEHYGDQIQWTGGAIWTKNEQWAGPGETSTGSRGWAGDPSVAVANGEKGYLIPKVEGFRVIPEYVGWNRTTIWERVIEDGVVTPEMFGAKISDKLGTRGSGTDCTLAIQAALDSPFNVRFNGGNYYISAQVFVKTMKSITGVGYTNTNPDQARQPTLISDRHITRIWTDRNTNFFNIQATCHIEKFQFNIEYTPEGQYDKAILNYDMSFANWGSSVWFCSFMGNVATTTKYEGKGGTAIRFNSEDADNTFVRRSNSLNPHGYVACWSSRKIHIMWMAEGHKIDPIKVNQVSTTTGININTWVNCTELDATFTGVKQAVRWEAGSVNRISGEYAQDGPCLPYAEREMPLFYLHCGQTTVDIGIGDVRSTVPAVNDDVLLGGSVTYPEEHYAGYLYSTNGSVNFTGRSLRDYEWGYSRTLANPKQLVDNLPFTNLDNHKGHFFWQKNYNKFSDVTSWIDNQFLYADLRSTVTVSTLRAPAAYDFSAAGDELAGTLSPSTGVTATYMSELWRAVGVQIPNINFGVGSDADNDFVEMVLKNPTGSPNFISKAGEILMQLSIGCKRVQVITRTSGAVVTNHLIDVSAHSTAVKNFRFPLTANNSTVKIILRFIGSTNVDTQIRSLHLNTYSLVNHPFLTVDGGTLLGGLTVPSLAFTAGSGFAPPEKRLVVNLSSADILSGNSGGIRTLIASDWLNIRSIYYQVTGGTVNYATNTNLEFFQSSRFYPLFSIDLSALVDNGRRRMIPVATNNLQYGAAGMAWQVQTGNPTAGNKSLRIVVDYTTGDPTS